MSVSVINRGGGSNKIDIENAIEQEYLSLDGEIGKNTFVEVNSDCRFEKTNRNTLNIYPSYSGTKYFVTNLYDNVFLIICYGESGGTSYRFSANVLTVPSDGSTPIPRYSNANTWPTCELSERVGEMNYASESVKLRTIDSTHALIVYATINKIYAQTITVTDSSIDFSIPKIIQGNDSTFFNNSVFLEQISETPCIYYAMFRRNLNSKYDICIARIVITKTTEYYHIGPTVIETYSDSKNNSSFGFHAYVLGKFTNNSVAYLYPTDTDIYKLKVCSANGSLIYPNQQEITLPIVEKNGVTLIPYSEQQASPKMIGMNGDTLLIYLQYADSLSKQEKRNIYDLVIAAKFSIDADGRYELLHFGEYLQCNEIGLNGSSYYRIFGYKNFVKLSDNIAVLKVQGSTTSNVALTIFTTEDTKVMRKNTLPLNASVSNVNLHHGDIISAENKVFMILGSTSSIVTFESVNFDSTVLVNKYKLSSSTISSRDGGVGVYPNIYTALTTSSADEVNKGKILIASSNG